MGIEKRNRELEFS
jgi:hypothetical protein